MKSIVITVSPEGEVEIKALGFKGAACEKATAELEKALGIKTKAVKTPDYYASETQQQKANQ